MLVRIESQHENCSPVGVYQDLTIHFMDDFCHDALLLPVPEQVIEAPDGGCPVFYFTEKGWRKHGTWLSGAFEPEAQKEEGELTFFAYIIPNECEIHPLYEDDFQVALCYEEASFSCEFAGSINSVKDFIKFEAEYGLA